MFILGLTETEMIFFFKNQRLTPHPPYASIREGEYLFWSYYLGRKLAKMGLFGKSLEYNEIVNQLFLHKLLS